MFAGQRLDDAAEKCKCICDSELSQIFNAATDCMAIIDHKFNVLRINRSYADLLCVDEDQAIGKKCYAVLRGSLCRTDKCPLEKMMAGSTEFSFEVKKKLPGNVEVPMLLSVSPFHSTGGERIGIIENLKDITQLKRSEQKLRKTLEKVQKGLDSTIEAMAAVVETRDPYTAGHQRRVAVLAEKIAEKMGLAGDQIKPVWVAATVHDIGKIYIPSEFLVKPSKLTDLEFSVIKTHPDVGYQILNKIEFPWPVAEIVRQHHERMDGSGYPSGLSGEQILLEARVISVADVVEAMSSHRPYRPSLGLELALHEITAHRHIRYDADVVEACLNVFRKKAFSEQWQ